jgi:hypothetical protein
VWALGSDSGAIGDWHGDRNFTAIACGERDLDDERILDLQKDNASQAKQHFSGRESGLAVLVAVVLGASDLLPLVLLANAANLVLNPRGNELPIASANDAFDFTAILVKTTVDCATERRVHIVVTTWF